MGLVLAGREIKQKTDIRENDMKILKLLAASSLLICTLSACGGGGGDTTTGGGGSTVVTGMATKGPFLKDSIVNVYAVVNGAKGTLLAQTKTSDDNGSYSADLGSYAGPVVVEVSGTYQDEATGGTVTIADTAPIRAALPLAQGSVTLPVTPLTELAVQKTGGNLSAAAITAANTLVSEIFKVDIVATLPVAPTTAALSGATQAQKDYTLALAAVSQMASEAAGASETEKLQTALAGLSEGISATGMTSAASTAFQGALTNFVVNPNNQTGISDTASTSLVNAGTLSKSYTLSLSGNSAAAQGLQFDLVLPQGVTVNTSLDSSLLTSSLSMGQAYSGALVASKYATGTVTVGIVSTPGISAGAFATVTCNIPAGTTAPAASAFSVSNLTVLDASENPMTGVAVLVN